MDNKIKSKISETLKRKYASGEIKHPLKGKMMSDETKKKIKLFKENCPNEKIKVMMFQDLINIGVIIK